MKWNNLSNPKYYVIFENEPVNRVNDFYISKFYYSNTLQKDLTYSTYNKDLALICDFALAQKIQKLCIKNSNPKSGSYLIKKIEL